MLRYGRTQKRVSFWLVCGVQGVYLDFMLPMVEVTAGLRIFLHLSHFCDSEDCDSESLL